MTDITLSIKDPTFEALIKLELLRCGKRVGCNGEKSAILITDGSYEKLNCDHIILISSSEHPMNADIVLRRPVDLSELRNSVEKLLNLNGKTVHIARFKSELSIRLLKSEHSALVGDNKISLTDNEFILLSSLIENRGTPISRDDINKLLNSGGNTPEVYICSLRKKLTLDDGRNPIITVRGKGYAIRQ